MFIVDEFYGKVVQVTDGDTIRVTAGAHLVTIRIAFLDAPESGQPYCLEAQRFLSKLIYGKNLLVKPISGDRYGRLIATLWIDEERDVSREILRAGWAWFYDPKHQDESYKKEELEAQKEGQGMWKAQGNIPPWEWRKNHNHQKI